MDTHDYNSQKPQLPRRWLPWRQKSTDPGEPGEVSKWEGRPVCAAAACAASEREEKESVRTKAHLHKQDVLVF
ncbi:Hypothetical predicted protein [Podarcis lilfordi]|uniref:Uncharacterized protein n=1 Tax=Podarcis lilfordi TaxID=74358 RepID=A0AA35PDH5_9SAUR|nr:Hypothetical predicted protein [Podarcis lilfordi]